MIGFVLGWVCAVLARRVRVTRPAPVAYRVGSVLAGGALGVAGLVALHVTGTTTWWALLALLVVVCAVTLHDAQVVGSRP